jgi:integrase/recombinase XerD
MSPLRRRMIEDMQIRNLTPNTQRVYVGQVVRFTRYFGKSPDQLGPSEIRVYLLHLSQDRHLAARSIIVTVAALRFFYAVTLKRTWTVEDDIPTGKQARKLPIVLSQGEVAQFLDAVDNLKHRVILTVCYAAGLRISEAVRLTPAAIDSQRMVIRVEQGKGRKDRYVMLSPRLLEMLRDYWKRTHPGAWLFPGDKPDRPISPLTLNLTCREVRAQSGISKPVLSAFAPDVTTRCGQRSRPMRPAGLRARRLHDGDGAVGGGWRGRAGCGACGGGERRGAGHSLDRTDRPPRTP